MTDLKRRWVIFDAIRVYGAHSQMLMMIEEMSELTKAISKYHRAGDDDKLVDAAIKSVREEMADVQIMLDQMKIMFGGTERIEQEKLERLNERLGEERMKGR